MEDKIEGNLYLTDFLCVFISIENGLIVSFQNRDLPIVVTSIHTGFGGTLNIPDKPSQ